MVPGLQNTPVTTEYSNLAVLKKIKKKAVVSSFKLQYLEVTM